MNPTTDAERAIRLAADKAIEVIFAMKKSRLCPILPVNDENVFTRIRCLLRLLAFEDNNGELPVGISEEFMHSVETHVFNVIGSANAMLPSSIQRSPFA